MWDDERRGHADGYFRCVYITVTHAGWSTRHGRRVSENFIRNVIDVCSRFYPAIFRFWFREEALFTQGSFYPATTVRNFVQYSYSGSVVDVCSLLFLYPPVFRFSFRENALCSPKGFLYLLPSDNRLDFLCSTEVLGVLARRLPDDGIRILSFELSPAGGSFRRLPVDPGSGLRAQIRVGAGCFETECVVLVRSSSSLSQFFYASGGTGRV